MSMKRYVLVMLAVAIALLGAESVSAQRMPERGLVRKGNRQYNREHYEKSIESYTKALAADPTSFEATFNLGSSLFRAERYEKAEQTLAKIVADTTRSEIDRSEAVYNLGNTQFAQQKFKEALESYRQAMRLNPDDQEAKYNYAFTKRLIQEQENQQNQQNDQQQNGQDQQQNGQNGEGEQDKQQGEQEQQNKDGQDQQQNGQSDQNPQEQQGSPNDPSQQEQSGEPQQSQGGISPQEQQAMLEAIQAQEDKTQDKLKEKKGVLIRGRRNW